ncbi:LytR/AlgR family response regulator transcription factor [Enterococcus columbae]|uniref:Stage 0 sporulation protein A homolog n=1 Tax=Enterococcus columbae DSM 7374 = ATCC 51263 TaxID=1121865 RepID=S0KU77_9ENTE|nr:LytTR family DNA-binding domain-containing protein [Enterococcus columbae]EOT44550.1 hypothetical protein OMW_00606 [Enterococcus columbae DSM 7374 = ATCC 51263]EOW84708.1 hypothetical protein I568_01204 [Enterococcus columbae DSM 7374 = ATCC 51263]OJG25211.1 hypothetical protein RR47_GL001999 [Enterococcus columbae DSM 7374 = ATCC 51263]
MLKIAVCDDNQEFTNYFEEIIEEIYPNNQFSIDVFNSPIRLVNVMKNNNYDIFFLDVEMPEMNGVDLAKQIRDFDVKSFIIYLTSYSQYMKEVFKVNTFDYLLKPINKQELVSTLERIIKIVNASFTYFKYRKGGNLYQVPFSNIIYLEKNGRYTILHGSSIEEKFIMTTDELISQLDESFIQVHKSFIINSRYIEILRKNIVECRLTDIYSQSYIQLPLGRKYKEQARDKVFKLLENQT